jgi:hypothetical protein
LGVVIDHGRTLVIETAANQGNPPMEGKIVFGIDDGEHAYYLKIRTARSGASHVLRQRAPQAITVDDGGEFVSRAMDEWAYAHDVRLDFIRPGSR